MKKLCLSLLCVISIYSCKQETKNTGGQTGDEGRSVLADSLTAQLDSLYSIGRINGFGVAIANKNGALYSKGFGLMDVKGQKPYSENTVQNIGSISKTFIGIALLKAQELGMLNLDDPVNNYLPFEVVNPYYPTESITIRHLATHTSSIRDTEVYDSKAYVLKEYVPDSLITMVEETLNPPETKTSFTDFLPELLVKDGMYYSDECFLEQKPGTRFEYSNIGATLAALVLEIVAEMSFDQFTKEHILDPLGMNSSGWSYNSINLQQHSKLYANIDTEIPFYELITYPDGGLRSSSHDMALYLTELIRAKNGNGRLLEQESYSEYFTPVLNDSHFEERDPDFPYNDEFNIGVFMGHSGTGNIGHTGGDPGITSLMFFDPETGLGQFVMINTSVIDEEGVNQLFGMMLALEEFGPKLAE